MRWSFFARSRCQTAKRHRPALFAKADGWPVLLFPQEKPEGAERRQTHRQKYPHRCRKAVRSLSARAACAGEPCCEQGPSRTRPTALHWRRFWASGPCSRARIAACSRATDPAAFAAFVSLPVQPLKAAPPSWSGRRPLASRERGCESRRRRRTSRLKDCPSASPVRLLRQQNAS